MDEPNENSIDNLSPEKAVSLLGVNSTDQAILQTALELRAALDDFRKTVLGAMEQKHLATHIRDPVWLNSRQVEQMLKICSKTLRRYREQNLISYRLTNRIYRYKYLDIKSFLEKEKLNY